MSQSGDTRRVVTREQVVHGGCRYFLRHRSIGMPALAESPAVSRATLYREVHRRDAALGNPAQGRRLDSRIAERAARTLLTDAA